MVKYFSFLWRIWVGFVLAMVTILLSPLLFLSVNVKGRKFFDISAYLWSKSVLVFSGLFSKVERSKKIDKKANYIIISNHASIIDIVLSYVIIDKSIAFIGKRELSKIPLFGYFYKKTNILIDRKNLMSRAYVYKEAKSYLNNKISIVIFPEGGIPKDRSIKLAKFKDGAFNLSVDSGVSLLPITFVNNKYKFPKKSKDGGSPGWLRVKIHDPISPKGLDKEYLKDKAYNIILDQILDFEKK